MKKEKTVTLKCPHCKDDLKDCKGFICPNCGNIEPREKTEDEF